MIEHLREEVPPHPGIGREVWEGDTVRVIRKHTHQACENMTYKAPHVCPIQDQFPQTKVDARVRSVLYPKNSINRGNVRFKSASNERGKARRDTGLVILRSRMGTRSSIDGKERWMRTAMVKSDADARPGIE